MLDHTLKPREISWCYPVVISVSPLPNAPDGLVLEQDADCNSEPRMMMKENIHDDHGHDQRQEKALKKSKSDHLSSALGGLKRW